MSTDQFWAEYRAQEEAERGKHADPSACGTCRHSVEASQPVEHDGCARRATLLAPPDMPDSEVLTEMTDQEKADLPARFHIPIFDDLGKPNAWLCAVCWGDGWNTAWPCATAMNQGAQVFTPQYDASNHQKKQQAELDRKDAEIGELQAKLAIRERQLEDMDAGVIA